MLSMYVRERERERERERKRDRKRERKCVCVRVRVCVNEKEYKRLGERESVHIPAGQCFICGWRANRAALPIATSSGPSQSGAREALVMVPWIVIFPHMGSSGSYSVPSLSYAYKYVCLHTSVYF